VLHGVLAGYTQVHRPVNVAANAVKHVRMEMSTLLAKGEKRIVLLWNDKVKDLDGYLKTPAKTWRRRRSRKRGGGTYWASCTVYFRHRKCYKDRAQTQLNSNLDLDDRDGMGPETITIRNKWEPGQFSYKVHQYSREGGKRGILKKSAAKVLLFHDDGTYSVFLLKNAAPGAVKGKLWYVFSIDGVTKKVTTCKDRHCR